MTPWRLFLDEAHSGARNMAVDEAMLLAHARGFAPPTLRFYAWQPHCLSLGRLQKQLPASVAAMAMRDEIGDPNASKFEADEADFDVVRRLTGGRAVWHAQEITYCAVVRAEILPPESRSVEGAYRWLSAGFLRGLHRLGLPVAMAPGGVRTNGANCFAASAACDFVADGKKLIGAAQCRKDGAILQHGSLLLAIDEAKWQRAGLASNREASGETSRAMEGATSLAALGAHLERGAIIEALCEGFAFEAEAQWKTGGLSERERALTELLDREKYGRREWTFGAKLAAPARAEAAQIEFDGRLENLLAKAARGAKK